MNHMKLGLIDAGGGLRGIYAAGALDFCMDNDITFDCCIGISAGSANVTSYLARQKGRNRHFYCEYAMRKQYMSLGNYLRTGSYIDMDYVYGTLSNSGGENPLDYPALAANPAQLIVVAEEAVSGKTVYFQKSDMRQDDYRILMASSTIPGVNRPYEINGTLYFDGALGDPVPIEKAFSEGCDRVVVLLTKPVSVPREPGKDPLLAKKIRKKYPLSAENLVHRAQKYNDSVESCKQYQQQGKVLIVAPENTEGVTTLSKNPPSLNRLYQRGYRDGQKILDWLQGSSHGQDA